MPLYGVPDADTPTIQFLAIRDRVKPRRIASRLRRSGLLGLCTAGVITGGATISALFILDAIRWAPMSPRWMHCLGAVCGITLTTCMAIALRDARRSSQRVATGSESKLLEGQADTRTQIALVRAEILAHIQMMAEWAEWRAERADIDATLAAYAELARTGTDDVGDTGGATISYLPGAGRI